MSDDAKTDPNELLPSVPPPSARFCNQPDECPSFVRLEGELGNLRKAVERYERRVEQMGTSAIENFQAIRDEIPGVKKRVDALNREHVHFHTRLERLEGEETTASEEVARLREQQKEDALVLRLVSEITSSHASWIQRAEAAARIESAATTRSMVPGLVHADTERTKKTARRWAMALAAAAGIAAGIYGEFREARVATQAADHAVETLHQKMKEPHP